METVYKVVRVEQLSGKRYSCMHWNTRATYPNPSDSVLDRGIVLEYTKGRVTKPKFGQILAFSNLKSAKGFALTMWRIEVWRCTTPKSRPMRLVGNDWFTFSLRPFWRLLGRRHTKNTMHAPPGTVACPQVCLKELLIRNG